MDGWLRNELSFNTTKLADEGGSASPNLDKCLLVAGFDDEDGNVSPNKNECLMQNGPDLDTTKFMDEEELLPNLKLDLLITSFCSSLPREDIQAIVEHGCPNVFRKAVNSAKRLRAYLHLDEGAVCSVCDLRGSCDKAYIIPVDGEGPRTVDVVRILFSYAMNPKQFCVSESSPVKEHIQKSARSLLFELIKLSDTPIDSSILKQVVKLPTPKETFPKINSNRNRASNIEMKQGDWLCPNCNFLNFARNLRCLECKEDGPKRVKMDSGNEMKKGDWNCPKCEFMNFARNRKCFRCQEQRPKRELNKGEWECPSCYYINFRGNELCKKCNHDRPEDEGNLFDDNLWRSQMKTTKDTIKFGDR
ncbi:hypothetical protein ZIOFF_013725 [Zingiber officinale]|uniref:RanBP2-type domain-containing protein n=1 Tax=Zingiber officinale TaxID=94328 RepID=A0A8J5HC18_ZINOF|nr:hypothetical protein ZIOFF_013725 [Zingiber officinale]